jgi:hypothetical protein
MLAWIAATALAQDVEDALTAVDAHGIVFVPQNGELVEPLVTYRPTRPCSWPAAGGLFLERAESPLVVRYRQEDGSVREETRLDDVTAVNLGLGIACHPAVNIAVTGPIYLGYDTETGHHGVAPGDPRIAGAFTPPGGERDALRWGLVSYVDFPIGPADGHVGRYKASGGLLGTFSWTDGGAWSLAWNVGGQLGPRPVFADVRGGPQVLATFAAGREVTPWLGVGAELQSRVFLASTSFPSTRAPTELLAHGRFRRKNAPWVTVGGAAGLLPGVGAASWRVFVGTGIGDPAVHAEREEAAPVGRDPDNDGVVDELCPDHPETINGWKDEDGCPDGLAKLDVKVVDRTTGQPVPSAKIVVNGAAWNGAPLELRPEGSARVEVTAEGYAPAAADVRLSEGAVAQVFALEKLPL